MENITGCIRSYWERTDECDRQLPFAYIVTKAIALTPPTFSSDKIVHSVLFDQQ